MTDVTFKRIFLILLGVLACTWAYCIAVNPHEWLELTGMFLLVIAAGAWYAHGILVGSRINAAQRENLSKEQRKK